MFFRFTTLGPAFCPLCKKYRTNPGIPECGNCPIKKDTGMDGCVDSPYSRVSSAFKMWSDASFDYHRGDAPKWQIVVGPAVYSLTEAGEKKYIEDIENIKRQWGNK